MELFHFTSIENARNIQKSGLRISEKLKTYEEREAAVRRVDGIINNSRHRKGKPGLDREKAHYFVFDYDKWICKRNGVEAAVSVSIDKLDRNKLIIASHIIPELIYERVNNGNPEEIDLLCMHYWNDLFPFDFYIQNRKMINSTYRELWHYPFVPEVLYYGDIGPELLKVSVIEHPERAIIPRNELFSKWEHLIKRELFFDPDGVHGIRHSRNVLYLATSLAKGLNLNEMDLDIIAFSAALHDVGRIHNGEDPHHGKRSVQKINKHPEIYRILHNMFTGSQIERIERLISEHCIEDNGNDPLMSCLKDADALERVRFNGLDASFLRLDASQVMETLAIDLQKNRI